MALILVTDIRYFVDSPGGSSRLAYDLAHAFARDGHDVWYLCHAVAGSYPERETDGHVTVLRYRLPSGVSRGVLPRHIQHMRAAQDVLRRHLPGPPEVVHGHTPMQYLAARRLYGKTGRGCYTFHSPAVEEMDIVWRNQGLGGLLRLALGIPILKGMEREILESADVLTAASTYTRALLTKHYCADLTDRIRVIPGWTRLNRFRPLDEPVAEARNRLGWPVDRPVLFTLRRLESRMGLDNLLHAYGMLRQWGYSFHAVIGGTGAEEHRLLDLRNRLGLEAFVSFMGRIPDDLLPLAYGACDASVVPTAKLECFGLIALEALACGRPVLVTPVGTLPEIVRGFEPQWIASSATAEGIADLIRRYLDGNLPKYDSVLVGQKIQAYSLARAFNEYSRCLFPAVDAPDTPASERSMNASGRWRGRGHDR